MKKTGSILLALMFIFIVCRQAGATTCKFSQSWFSGGEAITDFVVSGGLPGRYNNDFNCDDTYVSQLCQVVYILRAGPVGPDADFRADGIMAYDSGFVSAAGTPAVFTAGTLPIRGTFSESGYHAAFSSSDELVHATANETAAPKPVAMLLFGLGLLGLAAVERKLQ